jgi:hypothetical protein
MAGSHTQVSGPAPKQARKGLEYKSGKLLLSSCHGGRVPSSWLAGDGGPARHLGLGEVGCRLLDLIPEYRVYPTVRRYPVALAFIARHVLLGAVEGARQGYRITRSELGALVPPHAIDAVLRDCRTEGRRMAATVQAVELVERALRGE